MLPSQGKSYPTPNVGETTTLILNFPFPQTDKTLSVVTDLEPPNSEAVCVFFFSLENPFSFSKMPSVERISDDSVWANSANTQATGISKESVQIIINYKPRKQTSESPPNHLASQWNILIKK